MDGSNRIHAQVQTSVSDPHIASVWRFLEWEVFVKMVERIFTLRYMLLAALTYKIHSRRNSSSMLSC